MSYVDDAESRYRSSAAPAPGSTDSKRLAFSARDARTSRGRVVAVGVHAVAGVEAGELELLGRARAEQRKKWSNTSGMRYHEGPVSNRNPSPLPGAGPAAELVARLEQGDAVPVACEQRGGREPGDAAADHDDPLGCRGHRAEPSGRDRRADRDRELLAVGHADARGDQPIGRRLAGTARRASRRGRAPRRRRRAPAAGARGSCARRSRGRRSMSSRMLALSASVNASGSMPREVVAAEHRASRRRGRAGS